MPILRWCSEHCSAYIFYYTVVVRFIQLRRKDWKLKHCPQLAVWFLQVPERITRTGYRQATIAWSQTCGSQIALFESRNNLGHSGSRHPAGPVVMLRTAIRFMVCKSVHVPLATSQYKYHRYSDYKLPDGPYGLITSCNHGYKLHLYSHM